MTVALVMRAKSGRRGSVAVVVFERRRGGILSEIHGKIFESVVSRHDDVVSAAETDALVVEDHVVLAAPAIWIPHSNA
jgi:hypothetical protein